MIRTEGLTHIHLMVSDLERSVRFYRDVFGLEERFRDGPMMVFMRTPGQRDTITLSGTKRPEDRAGECAGIAHFGFRRVDRDGIDLAIDEVVRAGGRLIEKGKHPSGEQFAYVADPDGYVIEL